MAFEPVKFSYGNIEESNKINSTSVFSLKHILNAVNHELYDAFGDIIMKIVNNNKHLYVEYRLSDYIANEILVKLKATGNSDEDEINYVTALFQRAKCMNPATNVINGCVDFNGSFYAMNDDMDEDINVNFAGFSTNTLNDIFNVHNAFLFSNYHFRTYDKDTFRKNIQGSIYYRDNAAFKKKLLSFTDNLAVFNLFPQYIIDDDMLDIWKYFFSAS
eukprot:315844_1